MKKNELKTGMVVELHNGDKRLVFDDNLFGNNGFDRLSNYNDDLKDESVRDFDIMKVYNYKSLVKFSELLNYDNLELIWERKEIELTDKEIEILKALKVLGFKYLARDEYVYLYAYNEKPLKNTARNLWLLIDGEYVKFNNGFNFIKWTDKEPTNIDDLLKGVRNQ